LDLLVISAPATGVDSHLCLIFVSEVKPREEKVSFVQLHNRYVVLHKKCVAETVCIKKCTIFFIYIRAVPACVCTIKLCHDFTLRKPHEINCITISGYCSVNRLV